MIYLILAIFSSAMISVIMRISETKIKSNVSMLAMNYFMCLILAGMYTGVGNLFPKTDGIGTTFFMGIINGALYLSGFLLLQINVRENGVVLSSTFMKLGLLVPMVLSIVVFGEKPEVMQIIGSLIALISIILINSDPDSKTEKLGGGLILLLLAGGSGDAMSKVYEEVGDPAFTEHFLLYTFLFALVFCVAILVYKKERVGKEEILFGLLIGVPNYFSARFLLRSLETVDAIIAYPTYSVGTIIVVSLIGVGIFKEKLGKRQWMAVGLILVALALLNI